MVDVLIRNVDPELYAEFKSDAAKRKATLAEELRIIFNRAKVLGGTMRDLRNVPTIRLNTPEARTASQNIDKLVQEAVFDDFTRHKRTRSTPRRK